MKFISKSEKKTIRFGRKLAKGLHGGEVIGLMGNLGAGKTVFIKGLAQGLSIKKTITSPSFVLMKLYRIRNKELGIRNFVHVDAYRLKDEKDLIEIGVLDWLGKKDTITVIEWADRVKKILSRRYLRDLPKKAIKIKIKFGKKNNERIITRY